MADNLFDFGGGSGFPCPQHLCGQVADCRRLHRAGKDRTPRCFSGQAVEIAIPATSAHNVDFPVFPPGQAFKFLHRLPVAFRKAPVNDGGNLPHSPRNPLSRGRAIFLDSPYHAVRRKKTPVVYLNPGGEPPVFFRKLRQLSVQAEPDRPELDVDATIRETGDNAGRLKVVYQRPRKNSIKVLLLMDSGGSMDYYAGLCSQLFQAAERSNSFKDLKVYYFHNCIYERLHLEPTLFDIGEDTDGVLSNLDSGYRVILVGDAMMAPEELYYPQYDWRARSYGKQAGIDYLRQLKERYDHIIWLNPQPRGELSAYWATSYDKLAQMFNMYDMTVEGLERGIKQLLVRF